MTNNPNIKKAVLENVLESDNQIGDMRQVAEDNGWKLDRVIKHVNEMPCLTCGTSPIYPFPWDEDAARERLDGYR